MPEFNPVRAKTVLQDKRLYKYRSFEKGKECIVEDIILNNKIRFAKPRELKDPLECRPQYILGKYSSPLYRKKLERWALKTQRHIGKNVNKSEFKKYIRSLSKEDHEKNVSLINEDNQKLLNEKWRILSLSSSPTQSTLWERYGDNNKGISLIFDATTFEFGGAFKVYYPENRLEIDVTSQDLHDIFHATILTKTTEWAYEEEYRVISTMPWEGYTVVLDAEQFFHFDSNLLLGMIFGNKTNKASKERILDMVKKRDADLELWQLHEGEKGELCIEKYNP